MFSTPMPTQKGKFHTASGDIFITSKGMIIVGSDITGSRVSLLVSCVTYHFWYCDVHISSTATSTMSATSLTWSLLNLNGKVNTRTSQASIRCEWKGAGQVHSHIHPLCLLTHSTRCHLTITAQGMEEIHLQVELDIISMAYSLPNAENDAGCIIFKISLNRAELWARNGSKLDHSWF
jgi:hypothetical protein